MNVVSNVFFSFGIAKVGIIFKSPNFFEKIFIFLFLPLINQAESSSMITENVFSLIIYPFLLSLWVS